MWAGAKLLAADVSVSSRILRRVLIGKQISRRERNFIVQTGVDLARLVPFSLFLIIPLAEFALPFALRLFPNMLPSQFQHQMKSEETLKKRLKARLELAKYLREVVEEKAKLVKVSDTNSVSYNCLWCLFLFELLTVILRPVPDSFFFFFSFCNLFFFASSLTGTQEDC